MPRISCDILTTSMLAIEASKQLLELTRIREKKRLTRYQETLKQEKRKNEFKYFDYGVTFHRDCVN